jgi:hypothetical protein
MEDAMSAGNPYQDSPETLSALNLQSLNQRSNVFNIERDWDVVLELRDADDVGAAILNGVTIVLLNIKHSNPNKAKVSLKNILVSGRNTLAIQGHNVDPPVWSLKYTLGIFDAQGRPAFEAINITMSGRTPHLGLQQEDRYYLVRP